MLLLDYANFPDIGSGVDVTFFFVFRTLTFNISSGNSLKVSSGVDVIFRSSQVESRRLCSIHRRSRFQVNVCSLNCSISIFNISW